MKIGESNSIAFQEKANDIMKQIDKYDATMLSYLVRLHEAMNGEKMDFTNIQNAVDALAKFNKRAEYNYLNNLLYPEKCKGVKIPSPIPVPSCSFQLHNCVTLSTNASGNLAFVFNPFYLGNNNDLTALNGTIISYGDEQSTINKVDWLSSFWVNNDDSLTGNMPNINWKPVNIGQGIPNVYDQYRLVSASIIVKYIGRLDITSGVIGGAIIYDDNKYLGTQYEYTVGGSPVLNVGLSHNLQLSKFGNFDLAMDSFYHQENLCLEGVRELYFPLDNSYEEYTQLTGVSKFATKLESIGDTQYVTFSMNDVDTYKSGFNQFVYVLGAPPNSSCFKVDIYCNFECLPNASFLNYLPLSLNADSVTSVEKKNAITVVQQKPIMSTKESSALVVKEPSIWEKLKKKFSNALPGIGKLIGMGLKAMIPGLKPGLALASTLIGMNNDQQAGMYEEDVE